MNTTEQQTPQVGVVIPATPAFAMPPTRYAPEMPADLLTYRPAPVAAVPVDQLAALVALAQQHTAPAVPPVDTRVSGQAKGMALVSVAGGAGVGGAMWGIGEGVGLIAGNAAGFMTAAIATAIMSGSIAGLWLIFRLTGLSRGGGGSAPAAPTTHTTNITQNVTATGLFGRASGTINHHH